MTGVSYAQMEVDEIKKVRSLQVEHTTAAENDLLKLIYKIQSKYVAGFANITAVCHRWKWSKLKFKKKKH